MQLDIVYGLLHRRIRKRVPRDSVSSVDCLLERARYVEETLGEANQSSTSSHNNNTANTNLRDKDNPSTSTGKNINPQTAAVKNVNPQTTTSDSSSNIDSSSATSKRVRPRCARCKRFGHTMDECKSKGNELACYGCGREGVIRSKCPTCKGKCKEDAPAAAADGKSMNDAGRGQTAKFIPRRDGPYRIREVYWVDYKSKLKRRASTVRLSQTQTGGGPPSVPPLSDIEKKFISIMGEGYGSGLPNVQVDPFAPQAITSSAAATEGAMVVWPADSPNLIESISRQEEVPSPAAVPPVIPQQEGLPTQPPLVQPLQGEIPLPRLVPRVRSRRRRGMSKEEARRQLVQLSQERLAVDQERLAVDQERLAVDQERLA
ncbi:hypothetical protein SFRURICE_003570, partial [Spodoptera frugiperda]